MNPIQILLSTSLLGCAVTAQLAFAQNASPQAAEPARSAGGKIFVKWCSDCHSTATGPGSVALQRKYQGAIPAILEQRNDLTPDYVKLMVRHGISFMPSFRKTEISDADLALLGAYLAASRGQTHRVTKRP